MHTLLLTFLLYLLHRRIVYYCPWWSILHLLILKTFGSSLLHFSVKADVNKGKTKAANIATSCFKLVQMRKQVFSNLDSGNAQNTMAKYFPEFIPLYHCRDISIQSAHRVDFAKYLYLSMMICSHKDSRPHQKDFKVVTQRDKYVWEVQAEWGKGQEEC